MSDLNIREAEERARRLLKEAEEDAFGPGFLEDMCARDFLALAALYREAIEALGRAHGLLDCWKYRMAEPSTCEEGRRCPPCLVADEAEAVLAKARTALK